MKKTETIKILGVIAAAYPNMKEITEIQINVWHESLKDLEAKPVQIAVQQYILEGTFPPSVAEIRKRAIAITKPELPDATTAYGEVQQAIKKFGYYRESEAMETLSPAARRTAKAMGWREMCHSEKPDVTRGQFLKMYETVLKREQTAALLPEGMKKEIEQIRDMTLQLSERLSLPE
jgi:hypothetical protein